MKGDMKAILYNNTVHVTTFYGSDFLSADFPGLARTWLRSLFGDIPVLFFNGAIGDISMENQLGERQYPEGSVQKMSRVAHLVTGETLRLLADAFFGNSVVMRHRFKRIEMPVRLPSPERLEWAQSVMAAYKESDRLNLDVATAFQTMELHRRFAGRAVEPVDIHAVSFDDLAFDLARQQANTMADYLRRMGPFEPHRLPLDEMEYTTMPEVSEKLAPRFQDI